MQKSMTSHVGGIFWAMYYGEENYSASPIQLKGIKKVGGWKRIKKIKD